MSGRCAITGLCCLTMFFGACAAPESDCKEPGTAAPEVVPAAAWGSEPDPIPEAKRHVPVRITVHHAGVRWNEGDDPYTKLRGLQSWGRSEKGWPDVPYHFLIAPDGRIFEGRDLAFSGETNTEYDVTGHALIQLFGNFEVQRVSVEQLRATVRLAAWLCRRLDIDPDTIAGHRDWSRQTVCPGRDLYRYIEDGSLRGWVRATLRGEQPDVGLEDPLPAGPIVPIPR